MLPGQGLCGPGIPVLDGRNERFMFVEGLFPPIPHRQRGPRGMDQMRGQPLQQILMRRYSVPLAPVLIAVILGPMAETELRRALAVSEGSLGILVGSPITVTLYLVLAAALIGTGVQHLRRRRAEARATPAESAADAEKSVETSVSR
jgi:hypothetical protein